MSTKQRYGGAVWDALWDICHPHDGFGWGWAGVGQVAARAGVSRPTAKKYLEAFVESGHVVFTNVGIVRGYMTADKPEASNIKEGV